MSRIASIALFSTLFVINLTSTFGQVRMTGSITGTIRDAESMVPISNVSILIEDLQIGAATDLEGRFEIREVPPGTHTIAVSHIGHQTERIAEVIVNIAVPTVVDVELIPTRVTAEEVVVKQTFFAREQRSDVSTFRLKSEEIRRFPGGFEDVVRTVATLPGVAIVNSQGRNDLLVRGGGPAENLYVVNGMVVPNINHFGSQGSSSGSVSFVNLNFVDEVDFSTGGFGSRYGDKLSSVLTLTLRQGRSDRFGGSATISATQYGLDFEGPFSNRGNYIFSARKSYLDLIFKAAGQPFVPIYTDFNFVFNYDFDPLNKFSFINLTALDKIERDQSSEENRVTNAGIMDNSQDQLINGINYRRIFNSGYSELTLNSNRNVYNFSQADEKQIRYFRSKATESELKAGISVHLNLKEYYDFNAGGSVTFTDIVNTTSFADSIYDRSGNKVSRSSLGLPGTIKENAVRYKNATFVEYQHELNVDLSLKIGVRNDMYDYLENANYFAPRTLIKYRLSDVSIIKASIGRYHQSPAYVWTLNPVNRKLKALKNDMSVLGWSYIPREDIRFGVEGYYKQYADLPAGATPETSYLVLTNSGVTYGGREDNFQSFGYLPLESTGKGKSLGIEFQIQKKFAQDRLYGQAALTISKSEFDAPNGDTYPGQYDQPVIFQVSGGYKPNPDWEFSGKFRKWEGSPFTPNYRPADNNGEIQNLPVEYLSRRLEPGHHLDLRVDHRINTDKYSWIIFLDIQNVYNYKLPAPPQYNFWEDKIESGSPIGILPSIGVTIKY